MPLTYRRFRNKTTGQIVHIPAGRYGNFLNTVRKLVSYVRHNIPRYYVAHLVLTLKEAEREIHYEHLHRVLQFISTRLKRAGSDFKYIAVKEIQKERLERYGEEAIHYHLLCIYSKAYVFPDGKDIGKSWGLGGIKITAPKVRIKVNKIVSYIGKYIGKGYEYEQLDVKKSFTASQIKQIYKLAPERLEKALAKFGKVVAECFKCTFTKVYGTLKQVPGYKYLVMEFESNWLFEGIHDEPF